MFSSIEIHNLRGIRHTKLTNFRRVNLLFGKNNSGKSTILEALLLISGISNPELPLKINKLRGYSRFNAEDVPLEFFNFDTATPIQIVTEGEHQRQLVINPIRISTHEIQLDKIENTDSLSSASVYGLDLLFNTENSGINRVILHLQSNEQTGKISMMKQYTEQLYAQYLPSNYLQGRSWTEKFSKITEKKEIQAVVQTLRLLDDRITDIRITGNDLRVDIGLPLLLPINLMGDGIRKMLEIVLAIYECRNGILLIDEIDNGLHFSAMPKLWKAVLLAARLNNTQLFVTTHNIDSLKGLMQTLKNNIDEQSEVTAYKVIRQTDGVVDTLRYDYAQMEYAIRQEMEVR